MKRRRLLTATVGATVLGGWLLANYGPGVTPAVAAPPIKEDPLAGVTQNWDKNLPAAQRFAVLSAFGGDAVRDNETGLVWERSPLITTHVWGVACFGCADRTAGGRKGWRLPSFAELASLIDPNAPAPQCCPQAILLRMCREQAPDIGRQRHFMGRTLLHGT